MYMLEKYLSKAPERESHAVVDICSGPSRRFAFSLKFHQKHPPEMISVKREGCFKNICTHTFLFIYKYINKTKNDIC
jgi:hypothetical protein